MVRKSITLGSRLGHTFVKSHVQRIEAITDPTSKCSVTYEATEYCGNVYVCPA